jgi:hypothetical protein
VCFLPPNAFSSKEKQLTGEKTMKSKGITAKGINWPRGWRPSEDADWILVKQ